MSFVFLGSFVGIFVGKLIGKKAQAIVFCVTVAWSIVTTSKKVCELRAKEAAEDKKNLLPENGEEEAADGTPEDEEGEDESAALIGDCDDKDDNFIDMKAAELEYQDMLL